MWQLAWKRRRRYFPNLFMYSVIFHHILAEKWSWSCNWSRSLPVILIFFQWSWSLSWWSLTSIGLITIHGRFWLSSLFISASLSLFAFAISEGDIKAVISWFSSEEVSWLKIEEYAKTNIKNHNKGDVGCVDVCRMYLFFFALYCVRLSFSQYSDSCSYRVGHLVVQLGWVDLDLGCSTILLGQ